MVLEILSKGEWGSFGQMGMDAGWIRQARSNAKYAFIWHLSYVCQISMICDDSGHERDGEEGGLSISNMKFAIP